MTDRLESTWDGDTLRIRATILRTSDNTVKDLTGMTGVVASAKKSTTTVSGVVSVTDAVNGVITAVFDGLLEEGNWLVQIRGTLDGDTQTVLSKWINVKPSVF